jgi:hypothetical protein
VAGRTESVALASVRHQARVEARLGRWQGTIDLEDDLSAGRRTDGLASYLSTPHGCSWHPVADPGPCRWRAVVRRDLDIRSAASTVADYADRQAAGWGWAGGEERLISLEVLVCPSLVGSAYLAA